MNQNLAADPFLDKTITLSAIAGFLLGKSGRLHSVQQACNVIRQSSVLGTVNNHTYQQRLVHGNEHSNSWLKATPISMVIGMEKPAWHLVDSSP